jgi:hypothetical protein
MFGKKYVFEIINHVSGILKNVTPNTMLEIVFQGLQILNFFRGNMPATWNMPAT